MRGGAVWSTIVEITEVLQTEGCHRDIGQSTIVEITEVLQTTKSTSWPDYLR